ncbi:MAG: hypothetical protein NTW13_03260 [Candidatus Omnitrophica bacterium]|nr:hypothetical protein [Candidatus Omnitrophota bacterium]
MNVLIAVRKFIGHREIIGNQKAKDFSAHLVVTVLGKIKMYVVVLIRQIGSRGKMPIEIL